MFAPIALPARSKFAAWVKVFLFSPWFILALAAELWGFSLQAFHLENMKDWGLVSIFPLSLIAAYLILLAGFASLYWRKHVENSVFALYVALLILMIHGTPLFLYGTLRYSWAWKHVGIIDYIIRHGGVNPSIDNLPVYHNWPGFFAVNALFTQLAGLRGAQEYAGWGPVFFEALFAFSLYALFQLFTADKRLCWLAVWIFLLTNWVGQDYFSPQAMAYFMMICVLILALRGYTALKPLHNQWQTRLRAAGRFLRLPPRLVEHVLALKQYAGFPRSENHLPQTMLTLMTLLIFATIVSAHQLTPFMGLLEISALVLAGVIRWWTLPFWMLALILFWLALPAHTYNSQVIGSTLESFGMINQTIDSSLVNVAILSPGQAVVSWMGRGLSALIVLLGGLGFFQRIRNGRFDLVVVLLAAMPIVVLFLNSYGGEALFRVYFFMLPYLAFFAAGVILPVETPRRAWWISGIIGLLSTLLLVAFLFAYYGKEGQYSFTQAEVDAAEYVYAHAVPNSLLVEGSRNYPTLFLNYENFTYVAIDREPLVSQQNLLADPVKVMHEWLSNDARYTTSYLFITRSQKIYVDEVGTLPRGSLDTIQALLAASDQFEIVYQNQDAIVFKARK